MEELDMPKRAAEALMMGLRLMEGVSVERFERMVGQTPVDYIGSDRLRRHVGGGFLETSQEGMRTTLRGRAVLNTLLAELLP